MRISIDNQVIEVKDAGTVLGAALDAGIYIPHLCAHPATGANAGMAPRSRIYRNGQPIVGDSTAPYAGCNLCLVEIEGQDGMHKACQTPVAEKMAVRTDSDTLRTARQANLAALLTASRHPVGCIACVMSDGCDRNICSMNTPEASRCCWKFHGCELRRVADHIGLPDGLGHTPAPPVSAGDNPVFSIDYSLCIGCLRCVSACEAIAQRGAIGFVNHAGGIAVGTVEADLKSSGCKFCLVCADVCPTGAIRENPARKKTNRLRRSLASSIFPPGNDVWLPLEAADLDAVPAREGVYRLCDRDQTVVQISGTADLKRDLLRERDEAESGTGFSFELDEMFMMRERQLIQQHMERFGDMPEKNKELDDLF
ncbi:hypothetical protein DSCO28_15750 [Desulfosarcina ovata subsp. sediminis]|uniref:Uncharacterized protein n=1 Tax=Desulfosarcina ovata subsp. sediminis TaxID=885957 RepID=A0A5K7ZN48_9BACT|nr:2Fe-2S iron-sulfur cluster-binding protein [Desulfosarcina ovata]BBO81009.1 hypothetical protein DSCO28_15750 [Desulfosarcina ovata subsp. sediminis]